MKRLEVHFSGRVQGVGFRYNTQIVAAGYDDVSGFVKNLPDGRVQLVVEGSAAGLERFLDELQQRMSGYIRDANIKRSDATGEFSQFEIRR